MKLEDVDKEVNSGLIYSWEVFIQMIY